MATGFNKKSEDPFICKICLDVFIDPVTLSCGHNFCKKCLEQLWSNTDALECPTCKTKLNAEPELVVNKTISKLVSKFRPQAIARAKQRAATAGENLCDVCPQPKRKAQKSCVVCLTSLCQSHLQPHLTLTGLKTHQLIEPQENLHTRVCQQHNKLLELFCNTDQQCVCVLCTYSDHKGHEVVPLKEASTQEELQLKENEMNIEEMINMRETKIKELQRSIEQSNANAAQQIADGVRVLIALKDSVVSDKTPSLIQKINSLKSDTEARAKCFINELEQEISVLKTRKTQVRTFLQTEDKLQLLKTMPKNSIPTTKDWTDVSIHPPKYSGTVARVLFQLEDELSKTNKQVFEAELKRAKSFEKDVKLDRHSAHPFLTVSIDCKRVLQGRHITYPKIRDNMFDGLYVFGKDSFSDSFYFEVVVSKKRTWTVGVARDTIHMKDITLLPKKGFWTIGLRHKTYYAYDENEVVLSTKSKPKTVGVFVDKGEGLIFFYDVKDASLMYSFTFDDLATDFKPFCSPGFYSPKNSASLTVGLPSRPLSLKRPTLHRVQSDTAGSPNRFPRQFHLPLPRLGPLI